MSEIAISLKDDDEILIEIEMSTVETALQEVSRSLARVETSIADLAGTVHNGSQYFDDQVRRREKLSRVVGDLTDLEARVRIHTNRK